MRLPQYKSCPHCGIKHGDAMMYSERMGRCVIVTMK